MTKQPAFGLCHAKHGASQKANLPVTIFTQPRFLIIASSILSFLSVLLLSSTGALASHHGSRSFPSSASSPTATGNHYSQQDHSRQFYNQHHHHGHHRHGHSSHPSDGAIDGQASMASNGSGGGSGANDNHNYHDDELDDHDILLQGMDDLEHISYLSMRNFNITDDGLLSLAASKLSDDFIRAKEDTETDWRSRHTRPSSVGGNQSRGASGLGGSVTGSGSVPTQTGADENASAMLSYEQASANARLNKDRLARMLGAFILRLRHNQIRRMRIDELEDVWRNMRSKYADDYPHEPPAKPLFEDAQSLADNGTQISVEDTLASGQEFSSEPRAARSSSRISHHNKQARSSQQQAPSIHRCKLVIKIYQLDLAMRQHKQQSQQLKQQHMQSELRADSNSVAQRGATDEPLRRQARLAYHVDGLEKMNASDSSSSGGSAEPLANQDDEINLVQASKLDTQRLMKLCQLAVNCHSADELVSLIGDRSTWPKAEVSPAMSNMAEYKTETSERDPADNSDDNGDERYRRWSMAGMGGARGRATVRDSLSLSLSKLCPLILFQLHGDDGMCSVRRDDRPGTATVWAFATLFVTIVCFCSLIGLSITPLLGPNATAAADDMSLSGSSSSSSSDDDGSVEIELSSMSSTSYDGGLRYATSRRFTHYQDPQDFRQRRLAPGIENRACLTLFEGLAVGSLVGSALFSLIPQAFELHERESNQSFLLKAVIIFFGTYLFFISERLMRITMDAHHKRKWARNNPSSTSSVSSARQAGHMTPARLDHRHKYHQSSSNGAGGGRRVTFKSVYKRTMTPTGDGPMKSTAARRERKRASRRGSDGTPSNLRIAVVSHAQPSDSNVVSKTSRARSVLAEDESCYWERRDLAANQMPYKREISTVALMIVLGDGLHNFIDGISIGAAFSESILSGVSVSVAVICEEFPHELGDFAVLVSSGLTVRQALGYNLLSAYTCYVGMAVGIVLGDVNDCASYISALAGGVFLYIALVDMMGELSAALEESSRGSIAKTFKLFILQNVGIFIGISIIFILSFIDF